MNKRYNEALKQADDLKTKMAVAEFLISKGYSLQTPLAQQKEQFKDLDFEILNPLGEIEAIEVEYSYQWLDQGKVPDFWNHLSVPCRKKPSKSKYIVRANKWLDTLAFTTLDRVRKSQIGKKPTQNPRSGERTSNEDFFFVEPDQWIYAFKKEGVWVQVDQFGNRC